MICGVHNMEYVELMKWIMWSPRNGACVVHKMSVVLKCFAQKLRHPPGREFRTKGKKGI